MGVLAWLIIAAFYSQNTLAPHPINFTHEEVEVDGQVYVVTFEHGQLSMREKGDLNGRFKSRVEFLQSLIYRKGPEHYARYGVPTRPPEETLGQLVGCLFFGILFLAACATLAAVIGWKVYSYFKTDEQEMDIPTVTAREKSNFHEFYLVHRSA